MDLVFTQQVSKVRQLADAISLSISCKELSEGDPLPSINFLSKKYSVSRDTVFKAFNELKQAGVVDSASTKGYFVCNAVNKVLLLLDAYSPFKYELHKALTKNLPLNCKIDLYFHQYSQERFNKIIAESIGRYNQYLVMNYQNDVYSQILDNLDPNKVLLLDFGKFAKDKFAYVCQGFDSTLYECLSDGLARLRKYKKIVFVFPKVTEHPRSCIPYFEKFCTDFGFQYDIVPEINPAIISEGVAYLILKHTDLVDTIKIARSRGYSLGKEIGVVVFNDEPIMEILDCGITTISTDFKQMGELAAQFIKTRRRLQTYIPTRLILRESL